MVFFKAQKIKSNLNNSFINSNLSLNISVDTSQRNFIANNLLDNQQIFLNNENNNNSVNNSPNINSINNIKIIHWNCNSVKNKIDELKQFLFINKPNIMSLNEIKCNEYEANEFLNINGYNNIYKVRAGKYGGGVALLVSDEMEYTELDLDPKFDIEAIGLNMVINKIKHIISLYNPPQTNLNKEFFEYIESKYKNYLIIGDLNAKSNIFGNEKSNKNGEILERIIFNLNCQIINENYEPTFHIIKNKNVEPDFHSFLDLFLGTTIYANNLIEYKIHNECSLNSIQLKQYHSPIEIRVSTNNYISNHIDNNIIEKNLNSTDVKIYSKRLYDKANWERFMIDIDKISLDNLDNSIDDIHDSILKILTIAIEKNIPKVKNDQKIRKPLKKLSVISI